MQAQTPFVKRKVPAAVAPASRTGAWSPTRGWAQDVSSGATIRPGSIRNGEVDSLDVCDILSIPKVRGDARKGISHVDEIPTNVDKGEAVGELAAVTG